MSITLDYHVFAHKQGRYQTAEASNGVSPGERAVLEQYFFGQTNSTAYLESLNHEPGVLWRRLDARYSLTRVVNGATDAQGRATLRFETVLVPAESVNQELKLARIVTSEWRFSPDGVSIGKPSEPRRQELHADTVSKIALAFRQSGRVILSSSEVSLIDVEKIISIFRGDPDFSLCYKSLNPHAPVAVNLVFGNVAETRPMPLPSAPKRGIDRTRPRPSTATRSPVPAITLVAVCVILVLQTVLTFLVIPKIGAGAQTDAMQEGINSQIASNESKLSTDIDTANQATLKKLDEMLERTEQRLQKLENMVNALEASIPKGIKSHIDDRRREADGKNTEFRKTALNDFRELSRRLDSLSTKLNRRLDALSTKDDVASLSKSIAAIEKVARDTNDVVQEWDSDSDSAEEGNNDERSK